MFTRKTYSKLMFNIDFIFHLKKSAKKRRIKSLFLISDVINNENSFRVVEEFYFCVNELFSKIRGLWFQLARKRHRLVRSHHERVIENIGR